MWISPGDITIYADDSPAKMWLFAHQKPYFSRAGQTDLLTFITQIFNLNSMDFVR